MSPAFLPSPTRLRSLARLALGVGCALTTAQCGPRVPAEATQGARTPPQRIVPASATAVDMLVALVEPARIAGFPSQALDYSTVSTSDPALAARVKFDAYQAEPVLALEPDLVVIDPWQALETTQRLREADVRIFVLPEIASWPDARAALLSLAAELDAGARARELVAALDARVERLSASASSKGRLRALCYSNFGAAGSTAGARTTIDEMMRLAGLVNLIAERGASGHVEISFEELLVLDPEVILVSRPLSLGEAHTGDRGGASERLLYGEPSLRGLRAVREKRIVALPAWLFATGSHELVRGAEELERAIDALRERLTREGKL